MKNIILALILALSSSCTKEVRYSKEDLLKKAQAGDSRISIVVPKMEEGVRCDSYTPACLSGHIVDLKGIQFLALEYPSQAEALNAAKKYRGFYTGNWFFDDVAGEPILEDFVQKHLEAKKP